MIRAILRKFKKAPEPRSGHKPFSIRFDDGSVHRIKHKKAPRKRIGGLMEKIAKMLGALILLAAVGVGSYAATGSIGQLVQSVSLSAETTKIIGTVNMAAAQTIAVTNAGTFAVQAAATLAAETTKIIGTINVAAGQTIAVTNAGTFAVQSSAVVSAPTVAKVGATTTSAQLIAANATRKGLQIKTDCANTDAVAINYGASAAVYASHDQLPPCASWEPPAGVVVQTAVQVISNSGTQNVRVIEYP